MIRTRIRVNFVHAIMAVFFLALGSVAAAAAADSWVPVKGDRVCLIGNVLAERMQHDGWLESLIQHRFPDRELVFRNLGFSGDEVGVRLRSQDFGTPDEWLTRCRADAVWAFFGFNECLTEGGLANFPDQLDEFIQHTLDQTYNGQSVPTLVVFSPIAFEQLPDPHLPSGGRLNRRLQRATRAMAEVCETHGVLFVDLFTATKAAYAAEHRPLTLNGHYLSSHGNRIVAEIIDHSLFGNQQIDEARIERIRDAVLDKNFHWFHRYRTTDGYNVYGGRAHKRYTDDISNLEVLQREMQVLDAMTANRDRLVWARARGRDHTVDDSNTPPFIPVKTNMPGPHAFLGGEEAIEKMTVLDGCRVQLFASEEDFPELVNPVQMAFDAHGRLFVAVWPSYPHWRPKDPMDDKLLVLEDLDGDGRADTCRTFAGGLNNPTGFEFWGNGVLVAMAPDLLFLEDTDQDGVADVRRRVLHGLDSADTHHTANSFVLGPDGALYFQEGIFHQSQIETIYGVQRNNNACVWRFEPRTWKVDRYVAYDFANPHGHVFDRWGQDFVHDGTSSDPFHCVLFSGHLDYPAKHARPPVLYQKRTRPCPATEILSSRHFPEAMRGNLLVGNVIGVQGILQYKITENQSSFAGSEQEPIVTSTDPNFRPTDMEIGPDGAIYVTDWQNPIIGHLQHHLRDPNRDKTHGRVYRITCTNRDLLDPPRIAGARVPDLLRLLTSPEDRVRYRVRIELSGRSTDQVMQHLDRWISGLDPDDDQYGHHLLEALWLHQQHHVVDAALLGNLLAYPDHRVRSAATRVVCYWRDHLDNALSLLKEKAADPHPQVRLEAIRSASFFRCAEAVEVPMISARFPTDRYIEFTRGETMKALDRYWRDAFAAGRRFDAGGQPGIQFLLGHIATAELLELTDEELVCEELARRPGVEENARREAIASLARLRNETVTRVLLSMLQQIDRSAAESTVVFDLGRLLTTQSRDELLRHRSALEELAVESGLSGSRQIGFVALIVADGDAERVWELANGSGRRTLDLVRAMPLVVDPTVRADMYPDVARLIDEELPEAWRGKAAAIRRAAMTALTYVRGKESETFDRLARCIRKGVDRTVAVAALQRIPTRYWPAERAAPLLNEIVDFVQSVPEAQRNTPAVLAAMRLGDALASLLPAAKAERARRRLGDLGIRQIRLGTLPHRMAYDKERLAVAAGETVEILFENADLMPHNFVITAPGTLESVGMLAESTAQQPGAFERHYVPPSDSILLSSRLLFSNDLQRLNFTAPQTPGVYPFVCTYPGHWRRMHGALYVVRDLDAYRSDPEAYLQEHPLPIKDELLLRNRPRKTWKYDDLAAALDESFYGRSFGNAKQMFEVANCVACHRLNNAGHQVGPDLAKLDPELSARDILRELLEPSRKINEKFYSYSFVLDSGRTVTGLVLKETPEEVHLLENPLAQSDPVVLKQSEIESRLKSTVSIMPEGLLDKLTRDEVLDLLAYVVARGNEHDAVFGDAHHHHAGSE